MFDEWTVEGERPVLRKRLCREDEGLANFQGGMMARIHDLLLEAIADDLGEPRDALRPRLVTAAAMAAMTSLEGSVDKKTAKPGAEGKAEALALFDNALLFLRGGIEALRTSSARPPSKLSWREVQAGPPRTPTNSTFSRPAAARAFAAVGQHLGRDVGGHDLALVGSGPQPPSVSPTARRSLPPATSSTRLPGPRGPPAPSSTMRLLT